MFVINRLNGRINRWIRETILQRYNFKNETKIKVMLLIFNPFLIQF
ncbi:hypothetical protein SAMN05443550_101536 [Pedobacter hartonius]|uniref:Uncharacterized protein n=1 Tax=Pedobacter hartonius TaxID=425514 RepID=A0A1H3X8J2_9SPHI|nr:hypothetical protein SAMN05443550_101536 [Pedobacter hartonius]